MAEGEGFSLSLRLVACATTIGALVTGGGVVRAQPLSDLEVCQPAAAAPLPIGEQLARAEDLRKAALKFERFDYDRCYRLGRSCYNDVESPMLSGVGDDAYRACRQFSGLERTTFNAWLPLKMRHISCITENLNRRADELKEAVLGPPTARRPSEVAAFIAQLSGQERTLDGSMLRRLASGATWCSVRTFRVRALCADGNGAIADGQGQQMLKWKVIDDRICLVAFGEAPSCFGVRTTGGQFALMTDKSETVEFISVVLGVIKSWSQSCPSK